MKLANVAIALTAVLGSVACQPTTVPPKVASVGRGAPVSPQLSYPTTEVASLGDELANYPVVGPFRVAVRGSSNGVR